jgi:hypothetical protein
VPRSTEDPTAEHREVLQFPIQLILSRHLTPVTLVCVATGSWLHLPGRHRTVHYGPGVEASDVQGPSPSPTEQLLRDSPTAAQAGHMHTVGFRPGALRHEHHMAHDVGQGSRSSQLPRTGGCGSLGMLGLDLIVMSPYEGNEVAIMLQKFISISSEVLLM